MFLMRSLGFIGYIHRPTIHYIQFNLFVVLYGSKELDNSIFIDVQL